MRCKLHPYANAVGVCAPCLRDRLIALAAERDQAGADCSSSSCGSSSPPQPAARARGHGHGHGDGRGFFPRSVSPYVAAHRRSDVCPASYASSHDHQPSLLFFRTPQVGPAAAASPDDEPGEIKKIVRRRSFLSSLFGGGRHGREGGKKEPPRRSTSWISSLVRRKRRPDAASSMPPPLDEEPESPGGSINSSWWFPSPSPGRQQHRRGRTGGSGASGDGISGFAMCLSPLVRPSNGGCRRRCQPSDPSCLGENHRRQQSAGGAASFGRNTSRKLADMSRFR